LALHEIGRRIGWRVWQLPRFCRCKEMLTVLGPYAAAGVEYYGIVRRDRSTTRKFTDKSVCFVTPQWREDGHISAAPALDHGYQCGEHDDHYNSDPQELLKSEMRVHQWNI
jgi:hypothetical protein